MNPHPPRRPRRRGPRAVLAVIVAIACMTFAGASTGSTSATLTSGDSGSHDVSTTGVGTTTVSITAPVNPGSYNCATVSLSWTAATNATAYSVEYQEGTGSWNTLVASQAGTSYNDTTGTHTNTPVTYRITPLRTPGVWTGTPGTATVNCGIGPVTDLQSFNKCTQMVLTWTKPYNTTTSYDLYVSTNGGASYTGPTTITATNPSGNYMYYIHAATNGTSYMYKIAPRVGGSQSSPTTAITMDTTFNTSSITLADPGGASGTLDAGDTLTIVYDKPAVETVALTDDKVFAAPRRDLYPGGTSASTATSFGRLRFNNNNLSNTGNVSATLNGTGVWSANGGIVNAKFTWTSDGTTSAGGTLNQANPTSWAWSQTNGVIQCDNTPPTLPAGTLTKANVNATVTPSGRW